MSTILFQKSTIDYFGCTPFNRIYESAENQSTRAVNVLRLSHVQGDETIDIARAFLRQCRA